MRPNTQALPDVENISMQSCEVLQCAKKGEGRREGEGSIVCDYVFGARQLSCLKGIEVTERVSSFSSPSKFVKRNRTRCVLHSFQLAAKGESNPCHADTGTVTQMNALLGEGY